MSETVICSQSEDIITLEDEPNKIIEITSDRSGRDLLIYQDNVLVGAARKINFSQSIKTVFNGHTVTIVAAVPQSKVEFVVDQGILAQGFFQLPTFPLNPSLVRLIPEGGVEQINGVDFNVQTNKVVFRDFGLDGFLDVGEVVSIHF